MNGKVGGDTAAALRHDDKSHRFQKKRLIRRNPEMQVKFVENLKWRLNTYMSSLKKEVRKGRGRDKCPSHMPRARGVPG